MGKSVGNLYVSLGLNSTPFTKGMAEAQERLRRFASSAKTGQSAFAGIAGSINVSCSALSRFNSLLTIGSIAYGAKQLIDIADKYSQLDGRLRLVTKSTEDLHTAQTGLYKIAQETRVGYEDTVDLYTRLARSSSQLGLSQTDLLSITESINKALIVSGASGDSAAAALMQLGQGLASGTLRGEELNSVMEQTPRLAQMIADGLGITIGQLRQYGKDGKLSAEEVTKALLSQAEKINGEFKQMPETVGQALTRLVTAFKDVVNETNKAASSTSSVADKINELTRYLEENKPEIISLATSLADVAKNASSSALNIASSLTPAIKALAGAIGEIPDAFLYAWLGGKLGGPWGAAAGFLGGTVADQSIKWWGNNDAKDLSAIQKAGDKSRYRTVDDFISATSAKEDVVVSASSPKKSSGNASGSGSSSKASAVIDENKKIVEELQKSLMTAEEAENEHYRKSLDAIAKYYGNRAELTDEDDKLRVKLTEAHKKKIEEIAGVPAWERELKALQDKYKTESELEDDRYKEQLNKLIEFRELGTRTKEEWDQLELEAKQSHEEELTRIEQEESEKRLAIHDQAEQAKRNLQEQTLSLVVGILQKLGQKHKALALVAIGIEKAKAIAQTMMAARVAATLAYASQLIPGDPTSIPRAIAAAKATEAMGYLNAGLIAATGLMEAGSVMGGSSGSSSYGFSSSSSGSSDSSSMSNGSSSSGSRSITIYGLNKNDLYTGEQVAALLNEFLADGGTLDIK
ncbi:MAG: tape measure protein [Geobacteraceae bacterium]|nr:tape measure protein [Geobacteraceae bacterium]